MAIVVGTPTIGTGTTTAYTCVSADNALIVGVADTIAAGTTHTVSVTFNGTTMSVLKQHFGQGNSALFYLRTPSVGTYNVVVTPSTSSIDSIRVFIVEVGNASSGQPGTTVGYTGSHSISTDVACTGANGVVFDVRVISIETGYTVGAGQTEIFNVIDMGSLANRTFLASYETYSSGTVTMSWTGDATDESVAAVEVKGISPTSYSLTASTASYAMTFWDAILRTVGITNISKPTTSFSNIAKPTTTVTNVSKPTTTFTNSSKPNP